MGYKVVITTRAHDDLFEAVRFLAAKSPLAALELGHCLLDAAESLEELPLRGAKVRHRDHVRRIPCGPWHAIYYRVRDSSRVIEIVRIWDGRRNPADLRIP